MGAETLETSLMIDDNSEYPFVCVKTADTGAFRVIFERHYRLVLNYLYGLTGSRDVAEELVQETFLQAYKSLHTLRDERKLERWLCGIAKHVAYNTLRSRRARVRTTNVEEQLLNSIQDEQISPDRQLLNNELNGVIQNALSRLDDDKRLVFTLKIVQQMSYAEIAEITGFTIAKLKSDLHRAKAVMRGFIEPYLEDADEL